MVPPATLQTDVPDPTCSIHTSVVHELRVPITVCLGHLELVQRDPIRHADSLQVVLDEFDRMAQLVEYLDTLTRAEDPDFLDPRPVGMGDLTDGVLAKASRLGDRRWRSSPYATDLVVCDPQRVTQALLALAGNAVHHTRPGDVVIIGSAVDDGCARLWVSDRGPGVPRAEQDRIFEQFVRGRHARGRYRGAGLGLPVARAIARAHGGDVDLVSEPHGGPTTFTVVLPHPA